MEACNLLFVVSAPSGAGKTTLCDAILETFPDMGRSISYTTRSPRGKERHGVDYHFVSDEAFSTMVRDDAFAEWAEVHGHRYGTAKAALRSSSEEPVDVILEIDVQGAGQIRDQKLPGVYVFILPPSLDVLEARLRGRGTEDEAALRRRLTAAREEIRHAHRFDYIIVNDRLDEAVDRFRSIVTAERSRSDRLAPRLEPKFPGLLGTGAGRRL